MTEEEKRTDESVEAERTFTFESGTTVTLKRVNNLFIGKVSLAAEEKWIAENGEVICPTYEIKVAGGGIEVNDHNETTIATEPWSEDEEAQAAWQKYHSDTQQLQAARIDATVRVCLKEGVVDDPPDDWCEMRAYYDLDVPDHPLDARFEWLHDASSGWAELIDCAWAIQTLPNRVEETAKAAESIFRDSVDAPGNGDDAAGDSEEAE